MNDFICKYFAMWHGSCPPLHAPSGISAFHQTVLWMPASLDLVGTVQAGLAGKCCAPPLQDNNGVIGLLEPMKKSPVPVQVQLSVPVVKVASGESGGT